MEPHETPTRHVIGCMTGTSLDALDAVLTRIIGRGLEMTAECVDMVSVPLPDELRSVLLSMASDEPHPAIEFMRAARYLGVVHAQACATLINQHPELEASGGVDFIVPHGQTVWHAPADALSWQLFDPWPIVRTLKVPVCYDLRQADLVAGGEGAPITPIADWVMYREHADVVINLGGVSNLTFLHDDIAQIEGFDQGPCNLMLDGLCRALFDERYDRDGQHALAGAINPQMQVVIQNATDEIHRDGSKGREQYSLAWCAALAESCLRVGSAEDVLRTAAHICALHISVFPLARGCKRWVVGGGGVHHPALMQSLQEQADPYEKYDVLATSDRFGIPAEAREAMGFAVLGALSADGVPVTLPAVTGSETPGVAGSWAYPEGPGERV
ncbi:MAG: anhydro-N-acetylmuramic acid kinase [Planctomycetota bacterium]